MTSIGVIKIVDNYLYIPTTRLHKEKRKKNDPLKGVNIGFTPFKGSNT